MIWLIIFASLGLRLVGINQSMWLDEAISANVAQMRWGEIISNFSVTDFHPPVYYLLLNLWTKIFGNGVIAMRSSSILFSLITIWLVYRIGILVKDKKLGLWAALFTGANPLLIYYSQELRMYSLTVMILMIAVYNWIRIVKNEENKINWICFNLATGLAFLTFYGSIFLTGAMILYFLVTKKWQKFLKCFWGVGAAVLVVSPLLIKQIELSGKMLNQITNWSLVLGKVNLKNLLLIPLKFSIGRISWLPKNYYYLTSGLWTLIVFGLAIKPSVKNKKMTWLLIMPILIGILFSFKSPLMQYFRFLYLVPVLMLVLAENKSKVLKTVLVIGFLGFSYLYLGNSEMYRENWKEAVESLDNGGKVYMIGSFGDPIKYYNSTILVQDFKTIKPEEKNITIIPYGEEIHGLKIENSLSDLGYKQVQQRDFRGVTVEKWEK